MEMIIQYLLLLQNKFIPNSIFKLAKKGEFFYIAHNKCELRKRLDF